MTLSGLGLTLNPTAIYQTALNAGFPPDTAVKMTAIAMKESGGNTNAHNTLPPDNSYGLWQINMYGSLGPARLAQFGISDPAQLFDPGANATAAYLLWGGNDANLNVAWAINDGGVNQSRYQSNLPVAMAAAQTVSGGDGGDGGVDGGGSNTIIDASLLPTDTNFSPGTLAVIGLGAVALFLFLSR